MSGAPAGPAPRSAAPRSADCSRCLALCCVGPGFAASADFAIDKPAGTPCPHLRADHACGIHAQLHERGFPGCVTFDCFGAGQQVVEVTFGGASRREPAMFAALEVLRPLHEVLALLDEAVASPAHGRAAADLRARVEEMVTRDAEALGTVDVGAVRREAGAVFDGMVAEAHAGHPSGDLRGRDLRGADLVGQDLRRRDLRAARLRGALLLGADLRGVDLDRAEMLGADLRGADVRGARLAGALLVTGPQLVAARGDAATTVPAHLRRPPHWIPSAP
ncbi:pentapeptide repeat-containing protein [Actinomycetospora chibensis]|uniref:Pentapeptide repeat-containing protein n=1 Tax=Actinomycetospora chibensis TaxID=663606 RepID=A0ABV9RFS9_9PSEU|nr:pentapeptide repeat-containing protein [Actinomycetospora chibensis]MDD7922903.1 pentapeptide repeat-containing protein [Actinomycetospora chibensis]